MGRQTVVNVFIESIGNRTKGLIDQDQSNKRQQSLEHFCGLLEDHEYKGQKNNYFIWCRKARFMNKQGGAGHRTQNTNDFGNFNFGFCHYHYIVTHPRTRALPLSKT